MMPEDEQKIVSIVFKRFYQLDVENLKWGEIDECIYTLDWMSDEEVIIEAAIKIQMQTSGTPRCKKTHTSDECFVPTIIEAIGHILNLYGETSELHKNNRFILLYYLALSQTGHILS